jgi:hypothetical protein
MYKSGSLGLPDNVLPPLQGKGIELSNEHEDIIRHEQTGKREEIGVAQSGGWFDRLLRYRDLIGLMILLAISAACTVAWVVKTSKPPVQVPMRHPEVRPGDISSR